MISHIFRLVGKIRFFISNFFVFTKKYRYFFVNVGNREAVQKHLVFMPIWASQIENIYNIFEIYMNMVISRLNYAFDKLCGIYSIYTGFLGESPRQK